MAASSENPSDGSDVRIKRAQYYVNNKLDELNNKDLPIRVDFNNDFLQTLSQYDVDGSKDNPLPHQGGGGASDHDPERRRGPLFPSLPVPSWKHLVDLDKARQAPGDSKTPWSEPRQIEFPPWYRVAIIGAGAAGLRTAMLLQRFGIPYKIFEAAERPGGRVFTYEFPQMGPQGKHDYFDVGAMRFPNNKANRTTFDLVKELQLEPKLIKYVFSQDENIYRYNNVETNRLTAEGAGDHFRDYPFVPLEYLNKKYTDPWKRTFYGVNACTLAAYDKFRKPLIDNFPEGWKKLLEYDWASTRSYLTQEEKYPQSVAHWMETRDSGTGGFDRALAEAVLESLEFDDPMTKAVDWHCFEGGTHVLIDAMLAVLRVPPSYNSRVTSVEQEFLYPHQVIPDLPEGRFWPRFPFMKVTFQDTKTDKTGVEYFGHVVSTSSFAALRTINTKKVPMTYKQRQAIRSLGYDPGVKVGIKFTSRWWEQGGQKQFGGSSYTDLQSRVVVYPSYGLHESGPGVLMATYNWNQDAYRYGALIQNPDWTSKSVQPKEPPSEKILLDQIYSDLAELHGVDEGKLRENTLGYRAFDWYHNPYTMGGWAQFAPGQFGLLYDSIVHTAGYGRFHFAGEVASHHHAWVAGALDSANRVVEEIIRLDFPPWIHKFNKEFTKSLIFSDETRSQEHFVRGLYSKELEVATSEVQK